MSYKKQYDTDAQALGYLRGKIREIEWNADIAREAIRIAEKYRTKAENQRIMLNQLQRGGDAEAVQGWIPFTRRPMTEEEQKDYPKCTFMFDCVLPDDGDEILVSNGRFVWMDIFCNDIDGCYLDSGDDIDEDMAWMPLPKPYREEREVEE